jgi:dephospho-CoA kinase
MNYLYLIQKKEFLDKPIYKIGLLKSIEKINKNHNIILLIKDENKLINLESLNNKLCNKFNRYDKKYYFEANENSIKYFVTQYVKKLCINNIDNLYENNKIHLIKNIILSNSSDSVKYEQLTKLCNKKLEVRNIIFNSNLDDKEKYELITDILHNNKLNNFGNENLDRINKDLILDSFNNLNFIDILNKYVQLIHFDRNHYENNNIKYDQTDIKLYHNFEWNNSNDNISLILTNSIKKLYLVIFAYTLQNSTNDLLYAKGLLTLNKINKLLNI